MSERAAQTADYRRVMGRHARSFSWASFFLPKALKDDVATVYAFCRWVDDLADEGLPAAEARAQLVSARRSLGSGRADEPVVAAFIEVAKRKGIPMRYAEQLIDGVSADAGRVRVENEAELLRYCYRVAGTVGLMMCHLFGVRSEAALPHAVDLGLAAQLTNICRDVREDARRDRVYLPMGQLRDAGLSAEALVDETASGRQLSVVIDVLLRRAGGLYRSADAGVRYLPPIARLAVLVASRVYEAIGLRLERKHGNDPMHGRTVVPWYVKLSCGLRALGAWLSLPLRRRRFYRLHQGEHHAPLQDLLSC